MPPVFKSIPSVSELLDSPPLKKLLEGAGRNSVVQHVRDFLEGLRSEIQSAAADSVPAVGELAERIAKWISQDRRRALSAVINATGSLLHPGLGRAPLAPAAAEAVGDLATGYCTLDVDPASGARARRDEAVEPLLQKLTGAEAAMVVNNASAAALLTLATLAAGKQVLVSRGQLVEIGSFRLPAVIDCSGAQLREVGATNRTRIDDFRDAISTDAAALMRVQFSEFKMTGVCEQPSLAELVSLAHRRNLPLIDVLGSGALADLSAYGVHDEPQVGASIRGGADLVLLDGDKLLGGPQCGLIIGRRALIHRIQQHPLATPLRVGKMTLAALAATLQLYEHPERLDQTLPVIEMLSTSLANLRHRAERLAPQLEALDEVAEAGVAEDATHLGAPLPGQQIPTCCVAVTPQKRDAEALAQALRSGPVAVWSRVRNGRLLLDLRTVQPAQDELLVAAFRDLH